ncbi:MAG: glycoside hydrolase family 127 protein [Caldilineaceae bacterium]|nr:glycoside hydrolase family 127 protein [Caldilineaceae bacterium]
MLVDTSQSPYAKLTSLPLDSVQWTGGFWDERFDRCRRVMVPNMWRLLEDPAISHAYANFLIAAGDEEGSHQGPQWHDGDFYKWMEGAAAVYAVSKDPELDALLDSLIELIGRVQRDDGYIHTPVIIRRRQGLADAERFHERLDFETYNMGHLMTTACVHYRATGKTSMLDLARKAADYLYRFYIESSPELARNAICPSHYMGVIELYRTTRDPRYLELGRNLVEIRDLVTNGGDDNQDRVPFRQQDRAVGHAVRANYLYAGVADIVAETGDESLMRVLETLWQSVVTQKMYITGGCGALYDGASPDGSEAQSTITRVHQAYGREYQLPNTSAHNETCANIANAMWNWRMLLLTGEARYADVMELVFYNSALAGISLDGKKFFYTNTLRQLDDLPYELRWSRTREPYISCFCCPPNLVRMIAEVNGYAYALTEDALWIHLYGSNRLTTATAAGDLLQLRQETDYPWDGHVTLTVEQPAASIQALMLRIPGWVNDATVSVNGEPVAETILSGRYFRLERNWTEGDVVELNLPMPAQLFQAHPLVEEVRNQVAVMRGPVVYCLESPDLPAGVRPMDVSLTDDAEFTLAESRDLPGIPALATMGIINGAEADEWNGLLYRELQPDEGAEMPIRLIPYYAWDNRGQSEMSVWLNRRTR